MLLDIHLHSAEHSKCSMADPLSLIRQALKKGVQGVVITEHNYLWSPSEIERIKKKAELQKNFLVLSGQEIRTEIGDVLVYGAEETIKEDMRLEEIRTNYPDAAIIWAHPFRSGKLPSAEQLTSPHIDGVEVFNVNHTPKENHLALKMWHEHRFTAVAGSDAHNEKDAALFSTQFFHPVKDPSELAMEIKLGRCMPFVKEIPRAGSNLILTEIVMGTKGADESRNRFITKKFEGEKNWQKSKNSLRIRQFLHDNGFDSGKYRVPRVLDVNEDEKLYIEEGQRGELLFDTLSYVSPEIGSMYLEMSAEWLAKMHSAGFDIEKAENPLKREVKKFDSYLDSFSQTHNPYRERAARYIERVKRLQKKLFDEERDRFVQCHGDFHPKNIIIGQDRARDISTLFVSVIDFDSSLVISAESDLGCFISQFLYQFHEMPHVTEKYRMEGFVEAYAAARDLKAEDLDRNIKLFMLRTNLSIASFLIKVGKGQSEDMDLVMNGSESLYESLK
ncbi:MAG: phosphotransferase [Candidatus Omnitrophica bacterium]|nr:phosphotransferase [Candidatus Omnitrophota bacterium]